MLERHNDMWQMGAQYKTEQTLAAHRKEHVDGQAFGVVERKSNSEIAGKIPTRATEEENKTNQTFSHSQRSRHACVQKNLPPGGAGQPAQIARPSPATASWMVEQKKATKNQSQAMHSSDGKSGKFCLTWEWRTVLKNSCRREQQIKKKHGEVGRA